MMLLKSAIAAVGDSQSLVIRLPKLTQFLDLSHLLLPNTKLYLVL
jgi:hypothetical protein